VPSVITYEGNQDFLANHVYSVNDKIMIEESWPRNLQVYGLITPQYLSISRNLRKMRPFKGAIDIFTSSLLNVLWTFREARFGC